jgi:hypothetical protein
MHSSYVSNALACPLKHHTVLHIRLTLSTIGLRTAPPKTYLRPKRFSFSVATPSAAAHSPALLSFGSLPQLKSAVYSSNENTNTFYRASFGVKFRFARRVQQIAMGNNVLRNEHILIGARYIYLKLLFSAYGMT